MENNEENLSAKDSSPAQDKKAEKTGKPSSGTGKRIKHGTQAAVFTLVFLGLLVLVNVVATTLFERYPINIDLTRDKIYSVGDESEDYIKNVDTDVLVTVFAKEDEYTNYSPYTKQAAELLKNYCKLNHHISYRFIDIDSNPDVIKNYSDEVGSFDIVFETKSAVDGEDIKRTRRLGVVDLVNFNDDFISQLSQAGYSVEMAKEKMGGDMKFFSSYSNAVESSNAEQAFTSALMTVTDPDPVYVTFLTGRSEITDPVTNGSPLEYFSTLLTANGYNVNSIDITKEDIPEETDIAVIAAPTVDYLPEEAQKVSDFLNNGGELGKQLIYVASYSQDKTPVLDEFLAEYGLEVGEGVICETYGDNFINSPYLTIAAELSDAHRDSMMTKDPVINTIYSRPVNTLFDEQHMLSTEKCVMSTDNAYTALITYDKQYQQVPGTPITKGKQCYMALGTKSRFTDDGTSTVCSNVICFGSEYMLQNNILSAEQYNNSEYVFSLLGELSHKSQGVFIKPKTISNDPFEINAKQRSALMWTFIVFIPLAVVAVGLIVWLRRKNK